MTFMSGAGGVGKCTRDAAWNTPSRTFSHFLTPPHTLVHTPGDNHGAQRPEAGSHPWHDRP